MDAEILHAETNRAIARLTLADIIVYLESLNEETQENIWIGVTNRDFDLIGRELYAAIYNEVMSEIENA